MSLSLNVQARLALDQEETARSTRSISGISRIRPGHDALHRDRFTYHDDIHTEQDDLIAMAFINASDGIKRSLSPAHGCSPDPEDIGHRIGIDSTALSDHEERSTTNTLRDREPMMSPAAMTNGTNGIQAIHPVSFDDHYAHTFSPPATNGHNGSSEGGGQTDAKAGKGYGIGGARQAQGHRTQALCARPTPQMAPAPA